MAGQTAESRADYLVLKMAVQMADEKAGVLADSMAY
jgi:hypothetical protein